MGTGKGILIGIGISVAAIVAFSILSSGSVAGMNLSALRELKPIDMTKSYERNPIAVYNDCTTSMLTDKGRPMQSATVACHDNGGANFHFGAPAELVDSGLTCFTCKSKVYKYGENDYQLAFF